MRHLPAITHHFGHVFALQPGRHAHRRLLLAGRLDVTTDVSVRQLSRGHDLLRHSDVVCHASGAQKSSLRGTWSYNGLSASGRLYLHHCATIYRSACFTGKR